MPEPKQNDLIKEINAAWQAAQDRLTKLRQQVDEATMLARAKVEAGLLRSDLDKALYELGRAVWTQLKSGRLQLPPTLQGQLRAVREAQDRIDAQNADIAELLKEGLEMNELARAAKTPGKGMAPRPKKR